MARRPANRRLPAPIDGGRVAAPHTAIRFPTGDWEVENRGAAPDIEVEQGPKAAREGRGPQFEKAAEDVLESLEKDPTPRPKRPPSPNSRGKVDRGEAAEGSR